MEDAGVTGATLALLVVTLIAVLFAITFVLLVLLYLHYKRKLRAEAEAEAARSKHSRQVPFTRSFPQSTVHSYRARIWRSDLQASIQCCLQ